MHFLWAQKAMLDQSGFDVRISLDQIPDVKKQLLQHIEFGKGYGSAVLFDQLFDSEGAQIPRVVEAGWYQGTTFLTEYRYFETKNACLCAEFNVVDHPKAERTLDQLLAHMAAHYGKYEGVCQQLESIARTNR